jgi:hypothetical protein
MTLEDLRQLSESLRANPSIKYAFIVTTGHQIIEIGNRYENHTVFNSVIEPQS